MAGTAIRLANWVQSFRELVVWIAQDVNGKSSPSITAGTGAPSATKTKGSKFLRTDGAAGTEEYVSQGSGTWLARNDFSTVGAKADVIAESTSAAGVTVDGLLIKDGAIRGLQTVSSSAAAITGATALTLADAGGVFSVSQAAAYDIDLPSPTTGPGCRYTFYLTAPGANNVTITVLGGAATFVGTIVNDVTSVIPATGSTLTFATGASILGDSIEIVSISTSLYLVRAVSSAASSITIA